MLRNTRADNYLSPLNVLLPLSLSPQLSQLSAHSSLLSQLSQLFLSAHRSLLSPLLPSLLSLSLSCSLFLSPNAPSVCLSPSHSLSHLSPSLSHSHLAHAFLLAGCPELGTWWLRKVLLEPSGTCGDRRFVRTLEPSGGRRKFRKCTSRWLDEL